MRLIVLLDEEIDEKYLQNGDMIFTTWKVKAKDYPGHKTIHFESHLCDEEESVSECVNDIFSQLPKHYSIYKDSFYMKIMRPIASCLKSVENIIIENKIDELILTGGSKEPFLTTINAEAEGGKKWYRSSWLLNAFIYEYVRKRFSSVRIRWMGRNNGRKVRIINRIRENLFLGMRFGAEVLRIIKKQNPSDNTASFKAHNVFICMLPLQYKHLKYIAEKMTDGSSIFVISQNIEISPEEKRNCIRLAGCNIAEIYRLLRRCWNKLPDKKISSTLNGITVELRSRQIQRALYTVIFDHMVQMLQLTKTVNRITGIKNIITDMTFGPYMLSVHKYSGKRNIVYKNYQCVSMEKMLYPDLELADEYYMYSKQTFELYNKYSSTYRLYFPVYGEPVRHTSQGGLTVSVFLQPDEYAPAYLSVLEQLLPVLDKNSNVNKIIIKPHYRQNQVRLFHKLAERTQKCVYYDLSSSVEEVFRVTDVMMSISSSVLFEAVSYGVLGIICDIGGHWHDRIYAGDTCITQVNLYADKIDEITKIINNFNVFFEEYCERRKEYISSFE